MLRAPAEETLGLADVVGGGETGQLAAAEPINPRVLVYLNRLSDLLFVLARWVNAREGVEEPAWNPGAAG